MSVIIPLWLPSTLYILGPVHTNPFSNENGAVLLPFQKDLRPHLSFSYRFRPSTLQRRICLKTLLYPQCAWSNELDACAFQSIGPRNWGEIGAKLKLDDGACPPFWILTVEWFGAWWCLFWWRYRFQIASFSPSTLENSVFKKHRFQIAPLWRAFLNGYVFVDRFRRCSVDDCRIRSKTPPYS